jgi:glucose/mannose-6-phosphate isomerase
MGGSAMGGELAGLLVGRELARPMVVVRDYDLPSWVNDRTLLIAASFSGNTEETLAAFADAGRRRAVRVAVTGGGALERAARSDAVPIVPIVHDGPPRAALGGVLAAVLTALESAGLIGDPTREIAAAASAMRRVVAAAAAGNAAEDGGAAALAEYVVGRLPLVYVPESLSAVGRRWKSQINENAKSAAVWEALPELDHNSVVGLGVPAGLRDWAAVVFLSTPGTHERIRHRIRATGDVLDEAGIRHVAVESPPLEPFAEAMWLVQLGDLVSLELAERLGVDPVPVEAIDRLKSRLNEIG